MTTQDSAGRFASSARELRIVATSTRDIVALAAGVGLCTGLLVAGLDRLVVDMMLRPLRRGPLWVIAVAPAVGLVITALILRFGRTDAATADEYLRAVPDPAAALPTRTLPAKLAGAVATLGLGGAAGLEGPSIFAGSVIGATAHQRLRHRIRHVDRHAMVVAGAAAGVAAIFKAPATGAVFAIEVPYQGDLARHSIVPALVGAAGGYVAFAAINGTEPLAPVTGHPEVALVDLAVAALVGLACGIGARAFAAVMLAAKDLSARLAAPARILGGGSIMAVLAVASHQWFDGKVLTVGPGYEALRFALDPSRGILLLVALATMRVVATAATVGGGGVAGMFVPLVVQGALTGRILASLLHRTDTSLFVVVGIAAFLGAGYRVPLAAVMFVAEATGRPGFVVPGLVAATLAELTMGSASVTRYQRRAATRRVEVIDRAPGTGPEAQSGDPPPR